MGEVMRSNRVDEALQLFATLQEKLRLESRHGDVRRVARAASVGQRRLSGPTTREEKTQPKINTESLPLPLSSLPSSSSASLRPVSSGAELQRKLEVADGIMRRLHTKNKQLMQRLALAKQEGESGAGGATVRELRERLQEREEEVRRLRHRLKEAERRLKQSCGSSSSVHCANGSDGGDNTSVLILRRRVKQLEKQYNNLLERRVDDAMKLGSTEAKNNEVRELFMLMKSKMVSDACQHEEELRLLNKKLIETERRLASVHSGGEKRLGI